MNHTSKSIATPFAIVLSIILMTATHGVSLAQSNYSWTKQTSPTSESLLDVCATSSNNVYAVGTNGTAIHYDGYSWSSQSVPIQHAGENLTAVRAPASGGSVWAVGDYGNVYKNSGSGWTFVRNLTFFDLDAVLPFSDSDVWAGGGRTIAHYNGSVWDVVDTAIPVYWTVGSFYDLYGTSSSNIWGACNSQSGVSGILKCNGAVNSWSSQSSILDSWVGIDGVGTNNIWVVGDSDNKIAYFNGSSWSEQSHPDILALNDVSALNSSNVWAVGTDGIIYYNGSSWIWGSWNSGNYDMQYLNGVDALDTYHIWAVGGQGRIYFGTPSSGGGGGGGGSNFIDLSVSPATMSVGTGINLAFTCNAGLFNYQGVPVDVYWVIVVNPSISDQAATVDQLLSSGTVYYFSPPNKRGQMLMTSKLKGPSFPGVVLSTPTYSGTLTVNLGSNAGTFAFAMGFINRNTGALVGNITEVSNAFTLKRP